MADAAVAAVAPGPRTRARRGATIVAALAWSLLCVRWFDAAAPLRPAIVDAVPPFVFALLLFGSLAAMRGGRAPAAAPKEWDRGLLLVVVLAILFRLPMAWAGSAGYVTADGALSGLMALDVRDGRAHDVFVPHVPYSGSLKAHVTAPLAALVDPARAFAVVSLLFYAAFVAALYRLAVETGPASGPGRGSAALAAGLYAAFSPAFVTRYSLSNDGNYVEVLAFGTWALVLARRWAREGAARERRAFAIGLLIGLAFWCHILAVIPAAAIAVFLLVESPRDALTRALPSGVLGFLLGDLPGLLWNAVNGWDSFAYLQPGAVAATRDPAGAGGMGLVA
ncbi:MAG TPA: hypothetical protein VGQ33_17700, partial [Vicinamibacteria bacterium]|nr:hypothetical protein [Vicinamibacteria bacterium]